MQYLLGSQQPRRYVTRSVPLLAFPSIPIVPHIYWNSLRKANRFSPSRATGAYRYGKIQFSIHTSQLSE